MYTKEDREGATFNFIPFFFNILFGFDLIYVSLYLISSVEIMQILFEVCLVINFDANYFDVGMILDHTGKHTRVRKTEHNYSKIS